jgi:hypothetical protein
LGGKSFRFKEIILRKVGSSKGIYQRRYQEGRLLTTKGRVASVRSPYSERSFQEDSN